jgi:mono/diheme cytochrome c family protein
MLARRAPVYGCTVEKHAGSFAIATSRGGRTALLAVLAVLALVASGCRSHGGPAPPSDGAPDLYDGEHAFAFHCAKCHAPARQVVGPSLQEIAQLYGRTPDGPDAIVRWAKAPGRKRAGVEPMPSFAMLGDETLRNVAVYMIATGSR